MKPAAATRIDPVSRRRRADFHRGVDRRVRRARAEGARARSSVRRARPRAGTAACPTRCRNSTCPSARRMPRERIHAWWWPADDPGAPVVYYLHGVRWNLTGQLNRISQLRRFGFSVFAIDYRGFGKSDGEVPSEAIRVRGRARRLAMAGRARARCVAALHLRPLARRRGRHRSRRASFRRRRGRARADRRVVVHVAARAGVGNGLRLAARAHAADAEVRLDREDRAGPDAGADRARRRATATCRRA